jgi:hypothetical protein
MKDTLAYYGTDLITAVKKILLQASRQSLLFTDFPILSFLFLGGEKKIKPRTLTQCYKTF